LRKLGRRNVRVAKGPLRSSVGVPSVILWMLAMKM